MANKKINQLDTRTGAALTDLVLIGDPTSGTSFKLTATAFRTLLNLVPYTGATGGVNLGAFDLLVNELTIGKGLNGVANNTALGKRTLFHNTTGNYNTAVGHEAGHNLTTGQYNTAIGQSAMFTATTAGQNTAIGVNALLLATSGGSNVAVGLDTLQHITTGSSNTAIGYNAGSHITGGATPNTTATNSVFIGRDSKAAADGQTNQIVIGQNAVGNGSNTATFGNTATTANYFTGSVNGGSFVKSGGTSSQFLKADGSVDSSSYVGGSGATGQVAYWNGTNSQTGSNNLFWDAANARLGIGTNAPAFGLDVNGTAEIKGRLNITTTSNCELTLTNSGVISRWSNGTSVPWVGSISSHPFAFYTAVVERARFSTAGNFSIGATTDGGQRLQVYGDAFIKGSGATSATVALTVQNSAGLPIFSATNNRTTYFSSSSGYDGTVEINTPANRLAKIGFFEFTAGSGANWTGMGIRADGANRCVTLGLSGANTTDNNALIVSMGGSAGQGYSLKTSGIIEGALFDGFTFAPTSGTATFSQFVLRGTINQTGGANGITRGLYVNPTLTAAADWRSIEWSNNSGWGLYGAGTSANYLGGNLSLSTTNTPRRLNINQALGGNCAMIGLYASGGDFVSAIGAQVTTNNLQFASTVGILFYTGSTIGGIAAEPTNERMRLTTAGRLLLGTTTEGTFLLDVNGTARVSGQLSLSQATANRNLVLQAVGTSAEFGVGSAMTDYTFYNSGGTGLMKLNSNAVPTGGGNLLELPRSGASFAPTSGSADFTALYFQFIINQTGGANGITRGIYINPTLTSAADWRAIEVSAGVSVLAPSTTASATLRIPSGTAPTSPVNGDIWFDGTDLKMRIGGVTKTFTLV